MARNTDSITDLNTEWPVKYFATLVFWGWVLRLKFGSWLEWLIECWCVNASSHTILVREIPTTAASTTRKQIHTILLDVLTKTELHMQQVRHNRRPIVAELESYEQMNQPHSQADNNPHPHSKIAHQSNLLSCVDFHRKSCTLRWLLFCSVLSIPICYDVFHKCHTPFCYSKTLLPVFCLLNVVRIVRSTKLHVST